LPGRAGPAWRHRTEPLAITVYVDELLADRCDIHTQYQDAEAELDRRADQEASAAGADYEPSQYAWEYKRNDDAEWVAADPAAPPFSWDAWREWNLTDGADPENLAEQERFLRGLRDRDRELLLAMPPTILIPKDDTAGAEMIRREHINAEISDRYGDLLDRLEQQRRQEWTDYGQAVRRRLEAAAAELDGLAVPIDIRIVIDTYRSSDQQSRGGDTWTLEDQLLEKATAETATPDRLPGTPIDRLGRA
jgi:hypothetical protein